jgi:hypothetical protein
MTLSRRKPQAKAATLDLSQYNEQQLDRLEQTLQRTYQLQSQTPPKRRQMELRRMVNEDL